MSFVHMYISRNDVCKNASMVRCHGESGTPDFLYPCTQFPTELCIVMPYSHSAFCIPHCIPNVDTLSPTDLNDYATMIKSERLCERSRVLRGRAAIPMATLRREGVPDSVTMQWQEEIDDVRTENHTLHT